MQWHCGEEAEVGTTIFGIAEKGMLAFWSGKRDSSSPEVCPS